MPPRGGLQIEVHPNGDQHLPDGPTILLCSHADTALCSLSFKRAAHHHPHTVFQARGPVWSSGDDPGSYGFYLSVHLHLHSSLIFSRVEWSFKKVTEEVLFFFEWRK